MDFTVLGRTPEGVQVCMLVVLQTQRNTQEGRGLGRGDCEKGSEMRTGTRHD